MRLNSSTVARGLYRNKASIVMCHIPKTGGSSLAAALRRHYFFSNFNIRSEASMRAGLSQHGLQRDDAGAEEACQHLRSALAFYAAAQGIKFITGHLWRPLHLPAMKAMGYHALTLLRDPVDRWFSLYFYQRYKEGSYAKLDVALEAFLASDAGRDAGQVCVRYLGGIRADTDYGSSEAICQAKEGLAEFDLVGVLEDLPTFTRGIESRFGLRLAVPHKRKSPARKDDALLSQMRRYKESVEIRAEVSKLCAPDRELYELVRQRFA